MRYDSGKTNAEIYIYMCVRSKERVREERVQIQNGKEIQKGWESPGCFAGASAEKTYATYIGIYRDADVNAAGNTRISSTPLRPTRIRPLISCDNRLRDYYTTPAVSD